jgi:peptidyl-prolyl cis-trans isomerase SurA
VTRKNLAFCSFLMPLFAFLGGISLVAPGCSSGSKEAVVATIGKTPITLDDYEKLYLKSNGNGNADSARAASMEDRERFLDLMVKYRLKLTDAYQQGLDRRPELLGEIQQVKGSLASSYVTERELVAPGVRKLYDRSTEEIRASHILLTFRQGATREDSATVFRQAQDIIKEAKAGKDFGQLAVSFSQDPSAQQNKGDLYYFSVGRMVPEFEDAVYALKTGEISPTPISTRFGLHVIKVTDRKPAPGEVHASHIMVRFPSQTPSPQDTADAYAKILAINDSLTRGVDFAELAVRNSGDGGSSGRGGDLGWFTRGRWPQPFDEVAIQLRPGQVSSIVRTIYGYHIIKCYETRPPKTFEQSKQDLQNLFQQQKFQEEYANMLERTKREVQYIRYDSVVTAFLGAFDSTKTTRDSAWTAGITPAFGRTAMFRVGGAAVTVDTVLSMIRSRLEWSSLSLNPAPLRSALDKISEQVIFAAKSDMLERQDPAFAAILREYREGILLYQVEQEQVWNKVATNDSLLHGYFAAHRDKFMYPDRVRFTEIRAASEAQAQNIRAKLDQGKTIEHVALEDSVRMTAPVQYAVRFARGKAVLQQEGKRTCSEISAALMQDAGLKAMLIAYPDTGSRKTQNEKLARMRMDALKKSLIKAYGITADRLLSESRPQKLIRGRDSTGTTQRVDIQILGRQPLVISRIEQDVLPPASDDRARRADSLAPGAVSAPFFYKVGYSIVRLDRREPARQKTFEEAGAEVSSAFQDYESKRLETEWLGRIRQAYPVVVNKEVLKNAFTPAK